MFKRMTLVLVAALMLTACGQAQTAAPTAVPTTVPTTPPPTVAPTTPPPTAIPTIPPTAVPTAAPTAVPASPTIEPIPEAKPVEGIPVVLPVLETHPIADMDEPPAGMRRGDLDDPAIWVHPTDPTKSLVIGVLKEGGLEVYDLEGKVVQSIEAEGIRYNNVDLAYGFSLGGKSVDLAIATDRYKDLLVILSINPETGELTDITDPDGKLLFTPEGQESDETTTAYGIAIYRNPASGTFYAFVNRRETGEVAQFELLDTGKGSIGWKQVRSFTLPTPEGGETEDAQTEGMVADNELGFLYIGQENVGIWKIAAAPDGSNEATLIHKVRPDGENLEADVEGLTIYYTSGGKGYLLVSSQGDNTFAVYTREGDNTYIGQFQIGVNGAVDGSQECDGAQVINVPLGSRFSQGLFVVQDGLNDPAVMVEDDGEFENASTNFKYVPWESVAQAFNPPLVIDTTSYDPRKP